MSFAALCSGVSIGHGRLLDLALLPITKAQSAIASPRVFTTSACSSTSSADAALPTATPLGNSTGLTRARRLKPMFFIARAVAPMLPGCEVLTEQF